MFVAVLSDKPELREQFCKLAGTEIAGEEKADINFYLTTTNGRTITFVEPTHYPEKIQPLLYSLFNGGLRCINS